MRRRRRPVVPRELSDQIGAALAAVEDAQAGLGRAAADRAPLRDRRRAHASLTRALAEADGLLRQATALAKQGSYRDWSLWRHRLSSLDTARAVHLFAELDDPGVLPIGSTRAIDTGMSGPDLGDMQHGDSRPPGTTPGYGLDLEALLGATLGTHSTSTGSPRPGAVERLEHQRLTGAPTTHRGPSPRRAA